MIMPPTERLSPNCHSCPKSLACWQTVYFSDNLSSLGIILWYSSHLNRFIGILLSPISFTIKIHVFLNSNGKCVLAAAKERRYLRSMGQSSRPEIKVQTTSYIIIAKMLQPFKRQIFPGQF